MVVRMAARSDIPSTATLQTTWQKIITHDGREHRVSKVWYYWPYPGTYRITYIDRDSKELCGGLFVWPERTQAKEEG